MANDPIPTYSSDGKRLRGYSLEAAMRLEALSLVVVRRNRRGQVRAMHFRPQDGANPLRATANLGQRYSFLEHVGDHRAWAHKRLLQRQEVESLLGERIEDERALDRYLRRVFRAVPLSILREEPAPVVDIGEYKLQKGIE